MTPAGPLLLIGAGFLVMAFLLLVAPIVLVASRRKPWREVDGLWVAGWGFLLVGLGIVFSHRGWGGLVLPGVVAAAIGHVVQKRRTGGITR
jgi:hypothetical protein